MMQNWRVPCLQNLTRNHDNLNYINQLITLKQTKIAHWPQMESMEGAKKFASDKNVRGTILGNEQY